MAAPRYVFEMYDHVTCHIALDVEGESTYVTLVWLLAGMNPHVNVTLPATGVNLTTNLAGEPTPPTGNRHNDGSTIYYYLGKVNMFQNDRSIAEKQPNLSNLAGLIHKYTKNIRARIN